jgi:uncharacterized membrane protein YbaN (DUF454 family)
MSTNANHIGTVSAKVIAGIFILAFLAIGAVGLILPILPGVLFIALAVLLLARHFPSMDAWLRRNPKVSRYLDSTNEFLDLPIQTKARLGGWYIAKLLLDAAALILATVRSLLNRIA